MLYTAINNIYDDGFENHCNQCCQILPTFDVVYLNKKYKLQLNNQKHVRIYNKTNSIVSPYNKIKSIELNKYSKVITLCKNNWQDNISFKSKKAREIFDTLNEYLHYYAN